MTEEADKNIRAYFQKFEEFHDLLKDDLNIVLEKFDEVRIKKIWSIKKRLLLFLKLSLQ